MRRFFSALSDVRPRAVPAAGLYADRRRGMPAVRPHHAPSQRPLPVNRAQGPRAGNSAELAGARRALHRGYQRTANSGARRSRRKRHGHSYRQTGALHRMRRRAAGIHAARSDRLRHEQRVAAARPALPRTCGKRARPIEELDEFVEEFITAVEDEFPNCCIQFEDWAGVDAVRLLARYRERVCCFNDDIQGTAAVALAGIMGALRITAGKLSEQTFLFLGAGSAAIGIADLLTQSMVLEGTPDQGARARVWLFDVNGLVESTRNDLAEFQKPYAHTHRPCKDFRRSDRVDQADCYHRGQHGCEGIQSACDRGDGAN